MSLLLFDIPDQTSVIKLYGEEVQHVVAMEECSELTQAISKNYRAQNLPNTCETRDKARLNLIEEAADVLVCLQQLMTMYKITELDIQGFIDKKCKRQEERVNAELNRRNCGRETCEA